MLNFLHLTNNQWKSYRQAKTSRTLRAKRRREERTESSGLRDFTAKSIDKLSQAAINQLGELDRPDLGGLLVDPSSYETSWWICQSTQSDDLSREMG